MSRSDTDPDVVDVSRPKYVLGREVSFSHDPRTGQVLLGTITSSKQVILRSNATMITYDIYCSGTTFTNIPEENILQNSRSGKRYNTK